jgi:PhzF family phenazine biosynthesis protein
MRWLTIKRISTFTDKPYCGNPAWVIISDKVIEDDEKLLKLTRELNPISDMSFIFPQHGEVDFYLRFFSRSKEIGFSGHNTIAAYFGIASENLIKFNEPITIIKQKTKFGIQSVELRIRDKKLERATVSMPVPQFIGMPLDVKPISRILNIPLVEMLNAVYPITAVAAGITDIIVPVKSLKFLLNIQPDFHLMKSYCEWFSVSGILLWTMETLDPESTVHIRHFAPGIGINEEPASGVASTILGCYLVQNHIVAPDEMVRIVVEQGNSMQSPGIVYVHIYTYKEQVIRVTFGGRGLVTFEGKILLP